VRVRERRVSRGGLTVLPVVVALPDADPAVLGGNQRAAEHQPEDDRGSHGIQTGRLAGDWRPILREHIVRRVSQRAPEIDEHVEAEQHKPDHRRRAMESAGDLERVPAQEPHGDPTPEQDHRRHDEGRREQAHRQLWRPLRHVRATPLVVANEAPPGGRQLQDDRRDQGEPDEHVPRHEGVHPEQNGRDLHEDRGDEQQPHGPGQARVPVRIHGGHRYQSG
jgi:hypothetical protein